MSEEKNGKNPDTAADVKDIGSRCLDSQGYLLFAAILSPIRDKEGRLLIDFQYRRYHFSLEDSRQAVKALKGFIEKEIEQLIKSYEEEGGEKHD